MKLTVHRYADRKSAHANRAPRGQGVAPACKLDALPLRLLDIDRDAATLERNVRRLRSPQTHPYAIAKPRERLDRDAATRLRNESNERRPGNRCAFKLDRCAKLSECALELLAHRS